MLDLPTLFMQIVVILLMCRAVGWLFRRIHQPQVVGEMAAGILLGPSLMNTRGLMELVILNIARDISIVSETVFGMMALIMTCMTTPLLDWIYPAGRRKADRDAGGRPADTNGDA